MPVRSRRRFPAGLTAAAVVLLVAGPLVVGWVYLLVDRHRTRVAEGAGGPPPAAAPAPGGLVTVTGTAVRFSEDSITEGAAARLYLTVRTAPGVDVVCVFPPGSAKDEKYDDFTAGERVAVRGRLDSPPTAHSVGTLADCVLVSRRR